MKEANPWDSHEPWDKSHPFVYDLYAQPEKIFAAAVWYQDKELTTNCLPHNIGYGIVLSGFAHQQVINAMAEVGVKHGVCGFITSHNRFVDREEAMIIARANNQIVRKIPVDAASLFSEDLYLKQ